MDEIISFEEKMKTYLLDRGIILGKIEGEGSESLVFHVSPSDRETIAEFKEEMEKELGVIVEPSDMFGMSVVIVEAKEIDDTGLEPIASVDLEGEKTTDATLEVKPENQTAEILPPGQLASYRVTGLVDYTDEQGNIVGQLPKDSIQEVPVELGDAWVEAGQAERV